MIHLRTRGGEFEPKTVPQEGRAYVTVPSPVLEISDFDEILDQLLNLLIIKFTQYFYIEIELVDQQLIMFSKISCFFRIILARLSVQRSLI